MISFDQSLTELVQAPARHLRGRARVVDDAGRLRAHFRGVAGGRAGRPGRRRLGRGRAGAGDPADIPRARSSECRADDRLFPDRRLSVAVLIALSWPLARAGEADSRGGAVHRPAGQVGRGDGGAHAAPQGHAGAAGDMGQLGREAVRQDPRRPTTSPRWRRTWARCSSSPAWSSVTAAVAAGGERARRQDRPQPRQAEYPLKGPRITRVLKLLAEESTPPSSTRWPPPASPSRPRRGRPSSTIRRRAASEPPRVSETRTPPPRHGARRRAAPRRDRRRLEKAPPGRAEQRPRWAPYLDGQGRRHHLRALVRLRSVVAAAFKSGVTGGIRVDLTVYPLAFTWRRAAGILATLGFGVTLQKPFWLPSVAQQRSHAELRHHRARRGGRAALALRPLQEGAAPRADAARRRRAAQLLHRAEHGRRRGPARRRPTSFWRWAARCACTSRSGRRCGRSSAITSCSTPARCRPATEFGPASTYGLRAGGGLSFLVWPAASSWERPATTSAPRAGVHRQRHAAEGGLVGDRSILRRRVHHRLRVLTTAGHDIEQPMQSREVRQSFLDFFARHGHEVVRSSPLVPRTTRRCCSPTPA